MAVSSPNRLSKITADLNRHLRAFWLFTCNDIKVILLPHTAIGILQALTGGLLTTNAEPSLTAIFSRLHLVVIWNWLNLLTFNVTNQRCPESVAEDEVNKPWRPIPLGLITSPEACKLLLHLVPFGIIVSLLWTGAAMETVAMLVLNWLYNDLKGGSESVFYRHGLNALAFGLHTYASTMIVANEDYSMFSEWFLDSPPPKVFLLPLAMRWLAVEALIIFTTIHVMDLPDMEGDRQRSRRTLPLVMGENFARICLSMAVPAWSMGCLYFWGLILRDALTSVVLSGVGITIAWRTLQFRNVDSDERTYKLWCLWLILVYALPWLSTFTSSEIVGSV